MRRCLRISAVLWMAAAAFAQVPKAADGHPDLSGIWQTLGTADWDLEDHRPEAGPFYQLGAIGGVPPGRGVVEGGDIPYKPEAIAQRKQNRANRWKNDPEVKCYMPGIPRAAYLPYPFQIVQGSKVVLMAYSFATSNRVIEMGTPRSLRLTHGWARGTDAGRATRWLSTIADSTICRGSIAPAIIIATPCMSSSAIHGWIGIIFRYEATMEDPQVFTRPWKIALTLYRDVEPNATLPEFKCVEMTEEEAFCTATSTVPKPDRIAQR